MRPIVKVGRDVEREARAWLATLPRVDQSALQIVPEANNRVTIRYHDAAERTERLEGGVPPWSWAGLEDRVRGCDGLVVNFISGHEMELGACRALRAGFAGPIHADLHSLFLGSEPDGTRVARPLPELEAWLACFDSVQMNEAEAALAGASSDDRAGFLRGVLDAGPAVAIVTLGAAGVAWAERHGLETAVGRGRRAVGASDGARTATGSVTIRAPRKGDPTGCGDVWGAAFFARRMSGDPVGRAAQIATRLASRSVEHRGAEGLYDILDHEVST